MQWRGKSTLKWMCLEVIVVLYFLNESSIVALYSNLFEKFSKSEMKN